MQIYCDLVKEFIDHQDHGVIIFDGLRDTMVIDEICRLTQAKVIFIEVLPQIRYERVLKRGEKAGEHLLSCEAFLTHDTIP
jgi:dephospho-CoA kinase